MILYSIFIILIGLLCGVLLFYRQPWLATSELEPKSRGKNLPPVNITVIIPVRNEAENLPLLLSDLKNQTRPAFEIICVDDQSTDNSAEIILRQGVTLLQVEDKPSNWTGKTWACHLGANAATGDMLLFLDADVRLSPKAIEELVRVQQECGDVVSVQPFHQVKYFYEYFSFFFNAIQLAGNGVGFVKPGYEVSLFGPVIYLSKVDYNKIGGHEAVYTDVVEDLALGKILQKAGLSFRLFLGGDTISFRMYGDGFKALIQGWTKNFSTGAAKASPLLLLMVVIWIGGCTSVFASLMNAILVPNLYFFLLSLFFYGLWVFQLIIIGKQLGNFKKVGLILFPIFVLAFYLIFAYSLFKKIFKIPVVWKERKI